MINLKSKIYVAGHKGLVGSAIIRKLKKKGYKNIIFRSKKQLDLKNQKKVLSFLKGNKPDFIFIAAAKVGEFIQMTSIEQNLFLIICLFKLI